MSKAAELANLIGNINAGGGGVNRNLIINGMMQINQRGDSTGKTSGNYYACDRFKSDIYGVGTWSIAQSTSVPTGKGFKNSVKLDCTTANSSLGTDAYFIYQQRIEGHNLQQLAFGTSDAKPIVLSFYVKSNKTGTYHVGLFNVDNSRMNGRTYTIDSANTWEFKSISFDADTSAGFTDDNTHGLMLEFWLAGGTDYTSGSTPTAWTASNNTIRAGGLAVNLADSTDNEWLLTGVQLEIGQNPTSFEHEPVERTLAKCQRYLEIWSDVDSFNAHPASGYNNLYKAWLPFHTQKRTDPTVSTYGVGGYPSNAGYTDTDGVGNDAVSYSRISKHGFHISGVASPYSFQCAMSADAEL